MWREERSFGKLPVALWDVWTVYMCLLLFDCVFQEVPAASHLTTVAVKWPWLHLLTFRSLRTCDHSSPTCFLTATWKDLPSHCEGAVVLQLRGPEPELSAAGASVLVNAPL